MNQEPIHKEYRMGRPRLSLRERLERRREIDPETGCWNWTGHIDAKGYGQVRDAAMERRGTHRVAFEEYVGPIPDGLHLDHLCRNRACFNPAHLEPVSPRENVLRGLGHGAVNAAKTHCKRGHEFTPDNTIRDAANNRRCRACFNALLRRRYAEQKVRPVSDMTSMTQTQDASLLPYSPLTWGEIAARREDALVNLGILSLMAVERGALTYITDGEGAKWTATYREWLRASRMRGIR